MSAQHRGPMGRSAALLSQAGPSDSAPGPQDQALTATDTMNAGLRFSFTEWILGLWQFPHMCYKKVWNNPGQPCHPSIAVVPGLALASRPNSNGASLEMLWCAVFKAFKSR